MVEALVEGFGGGIGCRETSEALVEGFGVGKLVEALVEGLGVGTWWRDFV
jgi:hypothetical protein